MPELIFHPGRNVWIVRYKDKGKPKEEVFPNSAHAREDGERFIDNLKTEAA
jgi:hypothetical protein